MRFHLTKRVLGFPLKILSWNCLTPFIPKGKRKKMWSRWVLKSASDESSNGRGGSGIIQNFSNASLTRDKEWLPLLCWRGNQGLFVHDFCLLDKFHILCLKKTVRIWPRVHRARPHVSSFYSFFILLTLLPQSQFTAVAINSGLVKSNIYVES